MAEDAGATGHELSPEIAGGKSEATRRRLCRAVIRLLDRKPLREIRIPEIAALASVSRATFYFHFADVDEVVYAALRLMDDRRPNFTQMVIDIDLEGDTVAGIRHFIRKFLEDWDQNYAILRARTIASDEGDLRFRRHKVREFMPVVQAFEKKMLEADAKRGVVRSTATFSDAMVLIGSLERIGPVIHMYAGQAGLTRSGIIASAVTLFLAALFSPDVEGPVASGPKS